MTELVRGYRGKLGDCLDTAQPFTVRMETAGGAVYDTCCFGVDAQDKLSDDRYMVFYNQTVSPGGEIAFSESGGASDYTVSLGKLPQNIAKLVFTVSIDGEGTMGQIARHTLSVIQNGSELMRLTLSGKDFAQEKAIIGVEIYLKTVWRIAVVAGGFNGGLADLLSAYGGELAEEPAPETAPPQPVPVQQPAPPPAYTQPVQQPAPQPAYTQPVQQPVPPQPAYSQPAQNPAPRDAGAFTPPDFTPKPFVMMPLPEIPPVPRSVNDYHTVPLTEALSRINAGEKRVGYDTRPIPAPLPKEQMPPYDYYAQRGN